MMAMQPKPMSDTPASLKNLVEPLPASALMGLIKVSCGAGLLQTSRITTVDIYTTQVEQQPQLPTAPVPVCAVQQNNLVKVISTNRLQ